MATRPNTPEVQFTSKWIYRGNLVHIGTFDCHADHPHYGGLHYFDGDNMVVFPHTALEIRMAGQDPLIGTPNIAILYNKGTEYERVKLRDTRDRCDYFHFHPQLLRDAQAAFNPAAQDRPDNRFDETHERLNNASFLKERRLLHRLQNLNFKSKLEVEEVAIELLESILAQNGSRAQTGSRQKSQTRRVHREMVYQVEKIFATQIGESLGLQNIATELAVSPYHLSRVYRQQTGWSLHQALDQLRLRTALERLGDYRQNLNQLALELGYANHSHFTATFRRQFGVPPSKWHG